MIDELRRPLLSFVDKKLNEHRYIIGHDDEDASSAMVGAPAGTYNTSAVRS